MPGSSLHAAPRPAASRQSSSSSRSIFSPSFLSSSLLECYSTPDSGDRCSGAARFDDLLLLHSSFLLLDSSPSGFDFRLRLSLPTDLILFAQCRLSPIHSVIGGRVPIDRREYSISHSWRRRRGTATPRPATIWPRTTNCGDLRGRRRPAAPSASATTSSTAAAVLTTPPTHRPATPM